MDKHVIINVGRQFGSGGKSVATALGKILGIPVYDNELITKAAEQSGFSASLFEQNDEKKSLLRMGGIFNGNRFGGYAGTAINEDELFKVQSDVIRKIADEGDAIFVGRASDYVLRDRECLDVFITAPLEERMKRVSERMSISLEEAETLIRKKDKGRKDFYDFFTFGDNWGVASNYDLCIDSSKLGTEKTAEFIIEFGRSSGLIR